MRIALRRLKVFLPSHNLEDLANNRAAQGTRVVDADTGEDLGRRVPITMGVRLARSWQMRSRVEVDMYRRDSGGRLTSATEIVHVEVVELECGGELDSPMDAVAEGSVPAKEGIEELGRAFEDDR